MQTRKVKAATKDHIHVGVYEYMHYVIRLREEVTQLETMSVGEKRKKANKNVEAHVVDL